MIPIISYSSNELTEEENRKLLKYMIDSHLMKPSKPI